VYLFDGTTVTVPDTPENQAADPQVYNQKPGRGFPVARIGALISLACGAVVNLGSCRYAGKGQGDVSLLRRLGDVLAVGDGILADSPTANWAYIQQVQDQGDAGGVGPELGPRAEVPGGEVGAAHLGGVGVPPVDPHVPRLGREPDDPRPGRAVRLTDEVQTPERGECLRPRLRGRLADGRLVPFRRSRGPRERE
jgi:hypothetical protein